VAATAEPKLAIGTIDDRFEREADRAVDHAMWMPSASVRRGRTAAGRGASGAANRRVAHRRG
jgi:hypothetical protein